MLSAMRSSTKVVMGTLLAALLIGWLVLQVGMNIEGRGSFNSQDVGSVNGRPIRYQEWLEATRMASEQARAQNPGVSFTREDMQQLETEAFEQLVQQQILREEYRRRGISVTNAELADLVRRAPPPEIVQSPDFQTDGQFDPAKYQRFIEANNDQAEAFRLAMEARYRDELPRYKLLQAVTSDVYLSDAKLWTLWRDGHESLTVRALVIRPAILRDTAVSVTPEEARRYYDQHREEFRRPARAIMSYVALGKLPQAEDSTWVLNRMIALRDSIVGGRISFEDAARTVSDDSASAANGGSLGTFARGAMVAPFDRAAFSLPVGRVSEPVATQFGLHLIRVDRRAGDSVTARHILLPYARYGDRLDELEARADSLDRIAAEQDDGRLLDSAAQRLGLRVERAPEMLQGTPYVMGRYRVPDVGVWAFTEGRPGLTSPVVETNGFYVVFRLDSISEAGIAPFEAVAGDAQVRVSLEKKRELGRRMALRADSMLNAGRTMEQVAQDMYAGVQTLGPFVRTSTVPVLGTATAAVGAAFRLRIGERSGMQSNDEAFFFVQPVRRTNPDSAAWRAQIDQQRAQMIQLARRARAQLYVDALRRAADVDDRREELARQNARLADTVRN